MRTHPSTGRVPARHRLTRALTGTLATAVAATLLLPGAPAVADPTTDRAPRTSSTTTGSTSARLADAEATAATLRRQVDALELEAATAAQDQAEAAEALHHVISEELTADAALRQARQAGQEQRAQATRRARALYMSGGRDGMLATVLASPDSDLGDVLAGLRTVRTIVGDDTAATTAARHTVEDAVAGSARLQALRVERQRLERDADRAARDLADALGRQQSLLDQADATVRDLVEQRREEEEAAALTAAAEAAEALRLATGTTSGYQGLLAGGASAPTPGAQRAIDAAATQLGKPYQWGATGLATYDCSGLTQWAYRQAGVSIPRTSRAQYAALPKVPLDRMSAGDLVFFANGTAPSSIHHVGIYLGDGRMLHAPRTGDVIKISAVWRHNLYGAARPVIG